MQPHAQGRRLESLQPLRAQGPEQPGQHITEARARHGRMPTITQQQATVRRGHQAAGALEHHYRLVAARQGQGGGGPVRLYFGRGDPQQTRRLAGRYALSALYLMRYNVRELLGRRRPTRPTSDQTDQPSQE